MILVVYSKHPAYPDIPAYGDLYISSRYCLSTANFTPIPEGITFPHQGGRDFQTPITGHAKVFLRGNDGNANVLASRFVAQTSMGWSTNTV